MSTSDEPEEVRKLIYIDLQSGGGLTPETLREGFQHEFSQRLGQMVTRASDLPKIAIPYETEAEQVATALLLEARALYLHGFFYACIAMCGIVAERVMKDIFRSGILVSTNSSSIRPSEKAFDQLERVDLPSITNFCLETGLINKTVAKNAKELLELRNKYAHARGRDSEGDAKKAFDRLNAIVDETISVLNKIKFN